MSPCKTADGFRFHRFYRNVLPTSYTLAMTASEESDHAPSAAPATIAKIAELAGVSIPTVSKVVNGRAQVAPETRARVEAVIRSHGFQRRKRLPAPSTHVELVFHELEGAYAMEAIRGAERVAAGHGMAVALSQLGGRQSPRRGWVEDVLARRPSALVTVFCGLTASQHAQLHSRGIPVVVLDPTGKPDHCVPSVGAGNWTGALTATRHLLERGHCRIAAITGPLSVLSSRARLDGYRAALDAEGIALDPDLVREGNFNVDDGLAHARVLLRLAEPPTAIVTGNDLQALGVYQAAAEAGVRIPHDLSIVGFDDLPLAQWTSPPLTTIRQPLAEMAEAAVTMAIALSRGENLPQERIEY